MPDEDYLFNQFKSFFFWNPWLINFMSILNFLASWYTSNFQRINMVAHFLFDLTGYWLTG
jgi:hypothetical protein